MSVFLTVEVCTSIVEYSDNGIVTISDIYSNSVVEVLELGLSDIEIIRSACSNIVRDRSYLNGGYTSYRYLCSIKYDDYNITCSIRDIVPEHIRIIRDMTLQLL